MRRLPVLPSRFMPFRDLRFLVVEDHPFQRAVMVRLLQSLGAAATHVADDAMAATPCSVP